jgi:hypothetical protein
VVKPIGLLFVLWAWSKKLFPARDARVGTEDSKGSRPNFICFFLFFILLISITFVIIGKHQNGSSSSFGSTTWTFVHKMDLSCQLWAMKVHADTKIDGRNTKSFDPFWCFPMITKVIDQHEPSSPRVGTTSPFCERKSKSWTQS